MAIQDKQIRIHFSDGSIWEAEILVIATDRAIYYWKEKGEFSSLEESLREDTLPLFEDSPYEVIDWAKNNMGWSDLHAKWVGSTAIDKDNEWPNAKVEIHSPEPEGEKSHAI
jgi:hypothetical protein